MRLHAVATGLLLVSVVVSVLSHPIDETRHARHHMSKKTETARTFIKSLFGLFFQGQDLEDVSSWSRCALCKVTTSMIREFFEKGRAEADLVATIKWGCTFFHIETAEVCNGIVSEFQDEMFYVLQHTSMSTSDICAFIYGDDCGYPGNEMNWTVKQTNIPKPPVKPVPLPAPGAPTLRVLQISDAHIDPEYLEGSMADCNEPLCCHKDQQGSGLRRAGKWGTFSTCDLPLPTFENMLQYIKDNVKVDYVIWTGDIIEHNVWNQNRAKSIAQMRVFHQLLQQYLPNVPIYLALGNHESVPVNSFPLPSITGNRSIQWLYKEIIQQWSPWLPPNASDTITRGGYYIHRNVFPGLRIISLNMNYCNNMNWWVLINTTDPTSQLAWLVDELQDAENAGDHVHILGHIPPGVSDCFAIWSDNYNNIINRYESTVRGQFFGHTHSDEFEVFYDSQNTSRPFGVAYVSPSVSTFGTGNPSFRVYTIDGNYKNSTFAVLDHETYYMDLEGANKNGTRQPIWYKGYTMKSTYGLKSLQPQDFHDFVDDLSINGALFEKFYKYNMQLSPLDTSCDSVCRKTLLCKLTSSRSGNFAKCNA